MEKRPIIINLDTIQFKDLLVALDSITEELKNTSDKLVAIEGELKSLRIEIMDKKGKFN